MIKVLNSRLRKVEEDTRDRWLSRPEASDPWAWTKRFAAATPRYMQMVDWALPIAKANYPGYPKDDWPFMRADSVMAVQIKTTKPWTHPKHEPLHDLADIRRYFEEWNPTKEQMDALLMFGELHDLGKAYAQFDPAPWPLSWAHPSLFQNRRGGSARRSWH